MLDLERQRFSRRAVWSGYLEGVAIERMTGIDDSDSRDVILTIRAARGIMKQPSFDGLSGLVQECFGQDLLTGHLFLFLNRPRDRIKILYFDHDGLAIWYKKHE